MALVDFLDDLKKELGAEDKSLIELIPTGNPIYDIFSGGGLPTGGFVEFVGNPGSGKTTLALQILGNIKKIKPESILVIFDSERSMTEQRLKTFGIDPKKVILVQRGLTIEKLFDKISKIFEKIERMKMKGIPVYILWDSIAHTPSEKDVEVKDINQSIGTKAKVLNSLIRKYDELFLEYNTTMIGINQLSSNVAIGPQYAKTVQIAGLGDRVAPGGTGHYYVAFHFLVLDRKTKLTGTEFGFKGYIVQGSFLKNKSGVPFEEFLMVIDYKTGVDYFWTKFIYLKEAKVFKVNGGWYTLEGYTDETGKLKKFRGSACKEKYKTDEEFRKLFDQYWDTLSSELTRIIKSATSDDISQEVEENEEG